MKTERKTLSTHSLQAPKAQGYQAGNRRTAKDLKIEQELPCCQRGRVGRVFSSCRKIGLRGHRGPSQLCVRFAERGFAGSAAPPLDAALTEVPKLCAVVVLASTAGHGQSPLAFCGESRQNLIGSEVRLTPRFGLAPQPVSAGYGAVYCYLFTHGGLYIADLLSGIGPWILCSFAPTNHGPFADVLANLFFLRRLLQRHPVADSSARPRNRSLSYFHYGMASV